MNIWNYIQKQPNVMCTISVYSSHVNLKIENI